MSSAAWNIPEELGYEFKIFSGVDYGVRLNDGKEPAYLKVNDWYVEEYDLTSMLLTVDTRQDPFNELVCYVGSNPVLVISLDSESLSGVPVTIRIDYPTKDNRLYRLTMQSPKKYLSHSLVVMHSHTHLNNSLTADQNRYVSELDSDMTEKLSKLEFKIVESDDLDVVFVNPDEEELLCQII